MSEITISFKLHRKGNNAKLKDGNQMISSNDRSHYTVKMGISRFLRNLGQEKARELISSLDDYQPFGPDKPCKVLVRVKAPSRRTMDTPNWYPTVKPLLDGFTDAGLWEDDNNDIIEELSFVYGGLSKTKDYHIDIIISDVCNNQDYIKWFYVNLLRMKPTKAKSPQHG